MSVPNWAKGHARLWLEPWKVDPNPRKHARFKKALWEHGYVTPHFTISETSSRGSDGIRPIPTSKRTNAQRHGFLLEVVRHRNGDRPLAPIDWYRDPIHNRETGGATNSEHLYADATDWNASGSLKAILEDTFSFGGIGHGAVSGNVQHVDNGIANGGPRRWVYEGR